MWSGAGSHLRSHRPKPSVDHQLPTYNDLPLLQVVPRDPQACTVAVIDMTLPTDNNLRDTSETFTSPAARTRGLRVDRYAVPGVLPARIA
jgi:hypothetical protein